MEFETCAECNFKFSIPDEGEMWMCNDCIEKSQAEQEERDIEEYFEERSDIEKRIKNIEREVGLL